HSTAAAALGIGTCSSGLTPSAGGAVCPAVTPDGAGCGIGGEVFGSFMILNWIERSSRKQFAQRAKNRFVEIPLKRSGPEKFNRQSRRTNERPENPAKLAAK